MNHFCTSDTVRSSQVNDATNLPYNKRFQVCPKRSLWRSLPVHTINDYSSIHSHTINDHSSIHRQCCGSSRYIRSVTWKLINFIIRVFCWGLNYPKNMFFNFENKITVHRLERTNDAALRLPVVRQSSRRASYTHRHKQ